jgi:hypothetical protein
MVHILNKFLAFSEYTHTNRSIDASVTLKEKVMDTLRTASLYFYSMVTLYLSLTVHRGMGPQILGKFMKLIRFSRPNCTEFRFTRTPDYFS